MADFELLGLNESAPDARAPGASDRGTIVGGLRVAGLVELDGGADINGDPVATASRTNPLRRAVRIALTAASSGSNGIQVLDNAQADFGTGNYTLVRRIVVASTRPSASQILSQKHDGTNGRIITLLTTGVIRHTINGTNYDSTVALDSATNAFLDLAVVVTRETASAAGSVVFYSTGSQVGSSVTIPAGAPVSIDNAVSEYILGTSTTRVAGEVYNWLNYNRALTAAEVLSLSINGPALADIGASQVPIRQTDFSAGADGVTVSISGSVAGNIDGIGGVDDVLRHTVGGSDSSINISPAIRGGGYTFLSFDLYVPVGNATTTGYWMATTASASIGYVAGSGNFVAGIGSGIVARPTAGVWTRFYGLFLRTPAQNLRLWATNSAGAQLGGTSGDLIYIKNFVSFAAGITGQWNAEDAQSNTGQIFDSSGNKNHALLPAAGATIIGKEASVPKQVRWTNTWSGTNELQYIGGVNQNILPARAYIESIVGVVTGATVEDIIIGDGSDTDRYVTLTTGLAAGTVTFTLANRTTDGTNLKLTVDPDANATMSIAWTITYRTLE